VGRVLEQLAQLRQHDGKPDMRTYDMTMHYLADCNTKDTLTAPLLLVKQGVGSLLANLTQLSECAAEATRVESLLHPMQSLSQDVLDLMAECGGRGQIGQMFEEGVGHGLCVSAADGIISVFMWQVSCGILLLLLTVLLPWLWHSHHLPPLSCQCELPALPSLAIRGFWRTAVDAAVDSPLMTSTLHQTEEVVEPEMSMPVLPPSVPLLEPVAEGSHDVRRSADVCGASAEIAPANAVRQCSGHDIL